MKHHTVDVLVVGGGAGGAAAAIQASRRGVKTLLVSEFSWLGGMLTSAGVSCPDGNELLAFQTGIWGEFLRELQRRQLEGLDHGWVSFFDYEPRLGAQIFADWVAALPNLYWIMGETPQEVLRQGDRVVGVRFQNHTVQAQITIDGTELGDLLPLAGIPYRWGWELQSEWNEPSAPATENELTQRYPVQAPTWVVVMRDFGNATAPTIAASPSTTSANFTAAWENYGGEKFLNYGRLPNNRFMINWPIHGNDYGEGSDRLVQSEATRREFWQVALEHSQSFAQSIQQHLGQQYGLATDTFPKEATSPGGGAYALHPYYRESRRVCGNRTICEQDILPIAKGQTAALPIQIFAQSCVDVESVCESIAIGNYANDHHYPSGDIQLQPKSLRWGGRWTGTPFTIPYSSLIPANVDGFLACEKNISVSHIANGATRLQPVVLGIGQAAGMAAALCIEQGCQPRDLSVRSLQEALLTDPSAPAAIIPFYNLVPKHPDWLTWQLRYLNYPESYPNNGCCPLPCQPASSLSKQAQAIAGILHYKDAQDYQLVSDRTGESLQLVTLCPAINQQLLDLKHQQPLTVIGKVNQAGKWILVEAIAD